MVTEDDAGEMGKVCHGIAKEVVLYVDAIVVMRTPKTFTRLGAKKGAIEGRTKK